MSASVYEGGCLCSAVRYRVQGPPRVVELCHCSMCRRAAGAPVVAWASFPTAGFAYTRGQPARYASSPGATRSFCGRCGAQITFQFNDHPEELDLTLATLDDPAALAPIQHIFEANRVPWLLLGDDLPRYPGRKED